MFMVKEKNIDEAAKKSMQLNIPLTPELKGQWDQSIPRGVNKTWVGEILVQLWLGLAEPQRMQLIRHALEHGTIAIREQGISELVQRAFAAPEEEHQRRNSKRRAAKESA